ncbi:TOX high mobility group box family member 4 isoform X2 [Drosophila santomea]|uniref:TOX high mobility group box family member 4 isoform X2 n=1 Tax=Drosophila santomea TaxID=129105 RepID=UPI001955011A|nr:TOX high mobility group box family member 4 isoform X2 [Drosophila santomea]
MIWAWASDLYISLVAHSVIGMKKFLSRRMLSLDQSMLNDDDEENCDTYASGGGGVGGQNMLVQPEQQQNQPMAEAPSKPLAPFALFFRDTVTAIKQQNPSCSLEQMQVIVQTMWESLDETQKNVYALRHEQEKREYVRLMRGYRHQLSESEATSEADAPPAVAPNQSDIQPPALVTTKLEAVEDLPQPVDVQQPPPDQIQLLTEAARVQKCTREQCNKPAIINPDWEDEYCSNECVVIHCRNVFNHWVISMNS